MEVKHMSHGDRSTVSNVQDGFNVQKNMQNYKRSKNSFNIAWSNRYLN